MCKFDLFAQEEKNPGACKVVSTVYDLFIWMGSVRYC